MKEISWFIVRTQAGSLILAIDEICIMGKEEVDDLPESFSSQLSMDYMIEDNEQRYDIDATEEGLREKYFNAFNPDGEWSLLRRSSRGGGRGIRKILPPIYAEALDYSFDRKNISVVQPGGKGQMDLFVRMFKEFDIPVYTVFDVDKNSADQENIDKTLELLDFLDDPITDIEELETKIEKNYAFLNWNSMKC